MSSFINFERNKIVVGIDLGTSYSGISIFVPGTDGVVHASSPGCIAPQVKEPTVLVQTESGEWLFGHTALEYYADYCNGQQDESEEEKVKVYKLFKQDLMESDQVKFEELTVNASNTGCMESLLHIYTTTLHSLMVYALDRINRNKLSPEPITAMEIMWVLTVPAQMREHSKSFMREAATQAGIIDDFNASNLMMVLEPEAAAIALAEKDQGGLFTWGKKFLVVDCGGGTVDITSHQVIGVDPLRLKSLAKCDGGNFGSEHITENFSLWLNGILQQLDANECHRIQQKKGAMYRILEEFDKIKMQMSNTARIPYLSLRDLLDETDSREAFGLAINKYNETAPENHRVEFISRNGNLKLSKDLVVSFINPLLEKIVSSIDSVLADAKGRNHNIDFITVVGGFAANHVLRDYLQVFGEAMGIPMLFPDLLIHPQSAVVIGACRAGHLSYNCTGEAAGIVNRIATKTIGVFFEPDTFRKLIEIGEDIPVGTIKELVAYPTDFRQTDCAWTLYQSQKKDPQSCKGETILGRLIVEIPQRGNIADREMRTKFVFGEAEILVEIEYPKLNQRCKGTIEFSSL